ncbi:MAG: hypothetical protein AAF993_22995 [Pseudomonadota bacterium]
MKILHGLLLLVLAVLLFLMPTATPSAADLGQPHPQLTYGSIKHYSDLPPCGGVLEYNAPTEHWLENCHRLPVLTVMLGKLGEDDPQFATKKRLLIERIDTLRRQHGAKKP